MVISVAGEEVLDTAGGYVSWFSAIFKKSLELLAKKPILGNVGYEAIWTEKLRLKHVNMFQLLSILTRLSVGSCILALHGYSVC